MVKIKVAEATGGVLNWLVAKAEGLLEPQEYLGKMIPRVVIDPEYWSEDGKPMVRLNPCPQVYYRLDYSPSTDGAQAVPIIDKEGINLRNHMGTDTGWVAFVWVNHTPAHRAKGPTPLIAACRCVVIAKLGEEVEVPEELL